jgi:LysM repeat protein
MTTALSMNLAVPTTRPTAADRAGARSTAQPPVRLTRRGRIVVLAALVLLAVAAVSMVAAASSAAPAGQDRPPVTMVVGAGDTLWTIATAVDPEADPRATIAELRRLNELSGSTIEAGQELVLPAR